VNDQDLAGADTDSPALSAEILDDKGAFEWAEIDTGRRSDSIPSLATILNQ
jgi:hypothetical protein